MLSLIMVSITLAFYAMMRATEVLGNVTGARGWSIATRALGVFVLVAGVLVLVAAVVDFRLLMPVVEALHELLVPPIDR